MAERKLHIYDSRVARRHLERKVLTKPEYQAFLDNLEDCDHLADESSLTFATGARREARRNG